MPLLPSSTPSLPSSSSAARPALTGFAASREGGAAKAGDNPVRDVSLSTFVAEVIEASRRQIVVADFWAPWCGPCKQLGPVLEKLVRGHKGAVRLAKIDIDRNPEIAQQMGVQSIPAVFAFFQGRPVDGFMGALPEAQIKSWLDRLVKAAGGAVAGGEENALDAVLAQAAELLAAGDAAAARTIYAEVVEAEPSSAAAWAGLARCCLAQNDTAGARQVLDQVPPEAAKDKALAAARTAVELAEQAGKAGQGGAALSGLQAKVEKEPSDHQARFDLALAHYAAGEREAAVDHLLEIVRRNRGWNEEAARKQLVKLFEAFGPMDPLTIAARKRLSSILFS